MKQKLHEILVAIAFTIVAALFSLGVCAIVAGCATRGPVLPAPIPVELQPAPPAPAR